jgi:hypothetical protein
MLLYENDGRIMGVGAKSAFEKNDCECDTKMIRESRV